MKYANRLTKQQLTHFFQTTNKNPSYDFDLLSSYEGFLLTIIYLITVLCIVFGVYNGGSVARYITPTSRSHRKLKGRMIDYRRKIFAVIEGISTNRYDTLVKGERCQVDRLVERLRLNFRYISATIAASMPHLRMEGCIIISPFAFLYT